MLYIITFFILLVTLAVLIGTFLTTRNPTYMDTDDILLLRLICFNCIAIFGNIVLIIH